MMIHQSVRLLRYRDVQDSNFGQRMAIPTDVLSWFSSVSPINAAVVQNMVLPFSYKFAPSEGDQHVSK
jgi:hypothetical protein